MTRKNSWFQDTERVLRLYFRSMDRLEGLRARERSLLATIKALEIEAAEIKRIPSLTSQYSTQPATAHRSDPGYAKLMVQYDEHWKRVQSELLDAYKRLDRVRRRIARTEEQYLPIKQIVDKLDERAQKILEMRYLYGKSNYAISQVVWCSEATVRRSFVKAICFVAGRLGKR